MIVPFLALLSVAQVQGKPIEGTSTQAAGLKTVAVLPWSYRGGTETAVKTAKDTISLFFDKAKYEVLPAARVKNVWEDTMGKPAVKENLAEDDNLQDLPTPKDLLELGKQLNADMVCAGRARWHTKSVWVALGPKTKADCTVDLLLIDVKKGEIALEQHDIKADDTKRESGLETAGALFVSMGITALSGGPKTPHQQQAARTALGLAFEPWLKTAIAGDKKIK